MVDKEWNVEVVEGANELFEIMCIDVSKRMQDGTMLLVQLMSVLLLQGDQISNHIHILAF